jgi:predicted transcriptional regulator of viral defense system
VWSDPSRPKPTATDQVLKIINRSKKGVDIKTLMDKTSFNQKKVTNILQRTYKQGKIKRVGKGIYVAK